VIGVVGDLVEDIVVRLATTMNAASDTEAIVIRRRGGSAANVAAAVARGGHASRFIGHVGNDHVGDALVAALRADGAEVVGNRGGRTGSVVVLLDHTGERTMLTDRGCCDDLDHPDPDWLVGLTTLHVPVYSLINAPLSRTTQVLVGWAREAGIAVSIDASSAAVIASFGAEQLIRLLATMAPTVLFCNELEADTLRHSGDLDDVGAAITVVKHGGEPLELIQRNQAPVRVPALTVEGVRDTTGAGDAFAAGFLVALANGSSPVSAASFGHQSAARAIAAASTG